MLFLKVSTNESNRSKKDAYIWFAQIKETALN